MGAAIDGARGGLVLDDGNNVEGESTKIEEHAGDVDERSKEKHALAAEEAGEEQPSEPLGDGSGRRLG